MTTETEGGYVECECCGGKVHMYCDGNGVVVCGRCLCQDQNHLCENCEDDEDDN